ncbi:MAG: 3-hydroxyacyl-[acyl-carrier-protein] dehydratase FabZ [Rhizobiales bacterium 17-65-6]|nr:MAG: 3-hydroxyacyl-[acyl-carrier-protein] dehydratase FabZ [Rhizobiales bacterium 12-68-15]OYX84458.1 MAG: 3-hydroxyacyl-[acyl-carrier-protein] dehydratase FabZ [Azorhizobium sp. 32-67-21]OYX88918.1 MAG: 3-hydroxyacyl-[acyl-carrier-protein] dehydratase FabZ [Xanthobacter sp. 35-67-6]OYZ98361.1 MAG: 3-hydroxyacyl-[acyl-carrier-protein] dehydratase FabZ [Rhizobiales bacterium 17-65-6]
MSDIVTASTSVTVPEALGSADIHAILACLPHRYPFLLVDRIVKIEGDQSCVGIKNVTMNEPHFQGHFPGNPVMPGVLIIEGMAQTAGVISILANGGLPKEKAAPLVYFMTIDETKFRRPVVPGDVLEYHMTKHARRRNMWWFNGEARVGGELVAQARLGAMISGL